MAIAKLSPLKPVKLTLRCLQVRRQLQLLLQVQVVQRLRPLLRQQQPLPSTELDGTYTATHEGDQLTLTISSGKGTLTTLERDGEKEIEQVEIDSTNQRMIIGDDVHRYYINGNQLTVEDIDQEQDQDDTIVFTKQ